MEKNYKIGDRVRHTEFGTLGTVIDIEPDGAIYVSFESGAPGCFGEFHSPLSLIEVV